MADDKTVTGEPDLNRISLFEDRERRDWCLRLGCTEVQLLEAVQAVGHDAEAVRRYLAEHK